jgi:hypothetical protein
MGTDLKKDSAEKTSLATQWSRGILERHPNELCKPNGMFSQGARILSLRNFLIHRHILS